MSELTKVLLDLVPKAPEPPAWWYSARKKTHPEESGIERDVAWRVAWSLAVYDAAREVGTL